MQSKKLAAGLATLALTGLVAACGAIDTTPDGRVKTVYNTSLLPQDTNLTAMSYAAAETLVSNAQNTIDTGKTILFASLVNIDDVQRSSTFGRMVAEQMASRFAQMGYSVKELKLRSSMVVREQEGELMLSRDLQDLTAEYEAQAVVTGTYAVGKKAVYVTVRMVSIADNQVISSYDFGVPNGQNTRSLLASKPKRVLKPKPRMASLQPPPRKRELLESFKIYFEFDKAELTADGEHLIARARDALRKAPSSTLLLVSGHADRAGSDDYNEDLSQRRANLVRDLLIEQGLPPDRIRLEAFGEGKPSVDTPDGTREARNRRVEINLVQ